MALYMGNAYDIVSV